MNRKKTEEEVLRLLAGKRNADSIKQPIPQDLRTKVFERDAYRCLHCGDWHDLRADHIVPESKGGPTAFENLQTLCARCNAKKGARV